MVPPGVEPAKRALGEFSPIPDRSSFRRSAVDLVSEAQELLSKAIGDGAETSSWGSSPVRG